MCALLAFVNTLKNIRTIVISLSAYMTKGTVPAYTAISSTDEGCTSKLFIDFDVHNFKHKM